MGFDPLFQFIHEEDAAKAVIVRAAGRTALPLPEFVLRRALGRGGLPRLPAGALQHIEYPIVVDGSAFRKATGFKHELDEVATIKDYAAAFPREGLLATSSA